MSYKIGDKLYCKFTNKESIIRDIVGGQDLLPGVSTVTYYVVFNVDYKLESVLLLKELKYSFFTNQEIRKLKLERMNDV